MVLGEDGDGSEVERKTEAGETGDEWPSDSESLGKLELGIVTLSFEPEKQTTGSKKRRKHCMCNKDLRWLKYPLHWIFCMFDTNVIKYVMQGKNHILNWENKKFTMPTFCNNPLFEICINRRQPPMEKVIVFTQH